MLKYFIQTATLSLNKCLILYFRMLTTLILHFKYASHWIFKKSNEQNKKGEVKC